MKNLMAKAKGEAIKFVKASAVQVANLLTE